MHICCQSLRIYFNKDKKNPKNYIAQISMNKNLKTQKNLTRNYHNIEKLKVASVGITNRKHEDGGLQYAW